MAPTQAPPSQQLPAVQKLRIRYAKRGPLRFTSHRDFARAFERALRRLDAVGVAHASLRLVREAGRLAADDILITRQTDPGWASVFFLIKGLVIERGGMLSHGAIVAREFGIPCVVGVQHATRELFQAGQIEVDGDQGEVHVLDKIDSRLLA